MFGKKKKKKSGNAMERAIDSMIEDGEKKESQGKPEDKIEILKIKKKK